MNTKLTSLLSNAHTQKFVKIALVALAVLVPAVGGFQTFDQPPMPY